ncbi:MAG: DNA primase [Patescibacteria group bacterium]
MSQEIDEIKSKIDLVELISEYVKLIPAGANSRALCPFHNEKTPSFMVNREKQIWRCFGCGEGGDIFSFLMKIEGLEFVDALKILAQRAGVPLKTVNYQADSKKGRLHDLCLLAAKYWQGILWRSAKAESVRDYLKIRGTSEETAEDFMLGYALDSWDDLINFLNKKGFSEEEIFLAGLSVKKNQGVGFYDRFRGRLMFPIIDVMGRVAGFGGRALKNEETTRLDSRLDPVESERAAKQAKYINTPQTIIYNKSVILYGLFQAKDAIKKADNCILVEGYMDVLPSHQAGVKNVAAISGTALTAEQIKILKRYSNNLSLALDMDSAGQQAASRSIDLALQAEMNVKVITLPFGKDPGECIKNNPADWPKAIGEAQPIMDYYYQRITAGRDFNNPADKKIIIDFLLNKINGLGSPIDRDYWLKETSQRLLISENVLRELFAKIRSKNFSRPKNRFTAPAIMPRAIADKDLILLKRILAIIFVHPRYLGEVIDNLPVEYLANKPAIALYKDLVLFYNKNNNLLEKLTVDNSKEFDLFDLLNAWFKEKNSELEKESGQLVTEVFLLSQKDFSSLDAKEAKAEIDISLKLLKENYLAREIDLLTVELEKAEKESSPNRVKEIYERLSELIKRKNS